MKKFLAVFLSIVLVCTMSVVIVSAGDDDSIDGFVFDIAAVDVPITEETGLIITSTEALLESNGGWSVVILCEKVEENVYKAKQDAMAPTSEGKVDLTAIEMEQDDIVIIIHSATSNPDYEVQYPNVHQKLAALQVEAGMEFTLAGIDLAAGTVTNGTATVSTGENDDDDDDDDEPSREPISVYLTDFNKRVEAGNATIFTADFEGAVDGSIEADAGNFNWVAYLIAAPTDVEGQYIVTLTGTHLPDGESLQIPDGGFIVTAHVDDTNLGSDVNVNTAANRAALESFLVDDIITLTGVDFVAGTVSEDASVDLYLGDDDDDDDDEDPPVEDKMGEPNEDPAYVLEATAPANYVPGEEVTITITLMDVVPEDGLTLINFLLYYEDDKVEPKVKNNLDDDNAEMDDFLIVGPNASWEGFSKLEEDEARYNISFLTTSNHPAKEDGSIVIEISFIVNEDTTGDIVFQLPHVDNEAMDYGMNDYVGNGTKVTIAQAAAEESSEDTSVPEPGDAGMIAIAIVALIALAGATTIAVRKRSR